LISATDARRYFQEVIDRVHYTGEPVIVSKRSKTWVIIQPLEEDDENEIYSRIKQTEEEKGSQ